MRVRAVDQMICTRVPRDAAAVDKSQVFLAAGKEYDVHAMAVSGGILWLQIVDDIDYPAWYPCMYFELEDGTIPSDWQCQFFPRNKPEGLSLLLGPDFLRDEAAYDDMVELTPEQVDRFWKRVAAREGAAE